MATYSNYVCKYMISLAMETENDDITLHHNLDNSNQENSMNKLSGFFFFFFFGHFKAVPYPHLSVM